MTVFFLHCDWFFFLSIFTEFNYFTLSLAFTHSSIPASHSLSTIGSWFIRKTWLFPASHFQLKMNNIAKMVHNLHNSMNLMHTHCCDLLHTHAIHNREFLFLFYFIELNPEIVIFQWDSMAVVKWEEKCGSIFVIF